MGAQRVDPSRLLGGMVVLGRSTLVGSPRASSFGILIGHTCLTLALAETRDARLAWAAPEPQQEVFLRELRFERAQGEFGSHVVGGRAARVLLAAVRPLRRRLVDVIDEIPDMRRTFAHGLVRVSLRTKRDEQAAARMQTLGLDLGRPFVVFHTRAYPKTELDPRYFLRGTRATTYASAVERLHELGLQTVHVGNEVATSPLPVTVAVPPDHPDALLLQLWSVAHARFYVASDAGPYQLSWLLGTPCLHTNVLNLLGLYPLRSSDRCVPKLLVDRRNGDRLGLDRLMHDDFWVNDLRKTRLERFDYIDNASEDLVEAVEDMLADLDSPAPATTTQSWYRDCVERMLTSERSRSKIEAKIGVADVFVGDGRISRRFADRYARLPTAGTTTEIVADGPPDDWDPDAWRLVDAAAARLDDARARLAAQTRQRAKLDAALAGTEPRRPHAAPPPSRRGGLPRIVHHVRLGPHGDRLAAFRATEWERRHPSWHHRAWSEVSLPHGLRRIELYDRRRPLDERTLLLRLELLRLFGGLAPDPSLAPAGSLDDAVGTAELVATVDAAVLGATPQNPAVERLLDEPIVADAVASIAGMAGATLLPIEDVAVRAPLAAEEVLRLLEASYAALDAEIEAARRANLDLKAQTKRRAA